MVATAGQTPSFGARLILWLIPGLATTGTGTGKSACSCRAVRTSWVRFSRRAPTWRNTGTNHWIRCEFREVTTAFNRGEWPATGVCTMASHRLLLVTAVLGVCPAAWTQSPTYRLGKTPTP